VTASGQDSGSEGEARVWNLDTGELSFPPLKHGKPVSRAFFSPDGKRILTASIFTGFGNLKIWDASTGTLVTAIDTLFRLTDVKFRRDGGAILTAGGISVPGREEKDTAGAAVVWDTTTGKMIGKLMLHDDFVWQAAFSPEGSHVLTACSDGSARIWKV